MIICQVKFFKKFTKTFKFDLSREKGGMANGDDVVHTPFFTTRSNLTSPSSFLEKFYLEIILKRGGRRYNNVKRVA